jgi:hypothetical protein
LTPQVSEYDVSLKVYRGTECKAGDNWEDMIQFCSDDGDSNGSIYFNHVATVEDWYTIVVDGRSASYEDEDEGPYTLQVLLTCANEGCCCY